MRAPAITAVAVALVALAAAGSIGAGTGRTGAAITSVAFKGSKAPSIVVTGRGFGARPAYNPSYQPQTHQGCPAEKLATDGFDYGTAFWFQDPKASRGNTPSWRAGRYSGAQELDCIGLIIDGWSPTKVRFHFGSQYGRPATSTAPSTYELTSGDPFILKIKNTTFRGVVSFTG